MITKANLTLFACVLRSELGIKNPVHIAVRKSVRFCGAECFGLYDGEHLGGKKFLHKISIARNNCVTIEEVFATLAHEFIHAWQMENFLDVEHDAATRFTEWEKHFADYFLIDVVHMQNV